MSDRRFLVLDTETTGLEVREGHRIIEIGCVEVQNFRVTTRKFHKYVNPERDIDAEAQGVHRISRSQLANEPVFAEIADDFLDFIRDGEIVIHKASFDVSFLNNELARSGYTERVDGLCKIVDSFELAGRKHPRQANSLNALCKRYKVDATSREERHGALIDAELLARVYIRMTAGEVGLFDDATTHDESDETELDSAILEQRTPIIIRPSAEELTTHNDYMDSLREYANSQ